MLQSLSSCFWRMAMLLNNFFAIEVDFDQGQRQVAFLDLALFADMAE